MDITLLLLFIWGCIPNQMAVMRSTRPLFCCSPAELLGGCHSSLLLRCFWGVNIESSTAQRHSHMMWLLFTCDIVSLFLLFQHTNISHYDVTFIAVTIHYRYIVKVWRLSSYNPNIWPIRRRIAAVIFRNMAHLGDLTVNAMGTCNYGIKSARMVIMSLTRFNFMVWQHHETMGNAHSRARMCCFDEQF